MCMLFKCRQKSVPMLVYVFPILTLKRKHLGYADAVTQVDTRYCCLYLLHPKRSHIRIAHQQLEQLILMRIYKLCIVRTSAQEDLALGEVRSAFFSRVDKCPRFKISSQYSQPFVFGNIYVASPPTLSFRSSLRSANASLIILHPRFPFSHSPISSLILLSKSSTLSPSVIPLSLQLRLVHLECIGVLMGVLIIAIAPISRILGLSLLCSSWLICLNLASFFPVSVM